MSGSFAKRRIDVTFTRGAGTFTESGTDRVTVSGLRVSCQITKAGGASMSAAHVRVYGLTLSLMNQLATLGRLPGIGTLNSITISAGDDASGMGVVFTGNIAEAWADLNAAPQTAFEVMAYVGLGDALQPVPPTSYQGAASVPVIMASLATLMGLAFENNGVTAVLANPYFPGTARDQALRCVQAAGIEWNGGDNGVVAIWPRGGSRGGTIPLVSPQTGMIGYPTYTRFGVALRMLFNRNIAFGALIKVESSQAPACGQWRIYSLNYELESETPGGAWFTICEGANPDYAPVR